MKTRFSVAIALTLLLNLIAPPFSGATQNSGDAPPSDLGARISNIDQAIAERRFVDAANSAKKLEDALLLNAQSSELIKLADLCDRLSNTDCNEITESDRSALTSKAEDLLLRAWNENSRTVQGATVLGSFSKSTLEQLIPHVLNTGNNGALSADGAFTSSEGQIKKILENADTIQSDWIKEGKTKTRDIVIYSHGGLISEKKGLKTALRLLPLWLNNHIYPISIVWQSGAAESLSYMKEDRKSAGTQAGSGFVSFSLTKQKIILSTKLVEAAAKKSIRPIWEEMKRNALAISGMVDNSGNRTDGNTGGILLVKHLREYNKNFPGSLRIHLVGHSAGSIVLAGLLEKLSEQGLGVETMTLMAPAIRMDDFNTLVLPKLSQGKVKHLTIFDLNDELERKDLAAVKGVAYKGSLLYLVSRSLEGKADEGSEVPLLGMSKFLLKNLQDRSQEITLCGSDCRAEVIITDADQVESRSHAKHHGDFDDDQTTLQTIVKGIIEQCQR